MGGAPRGGRQCPPPAGAGTSSGGCPRPRAGAPPLHRWCQGILYRGWPWGVSTPGLGWRPRAWTGHRAVVSRYARHRGRGWVTSVPAMAGVEGVWCTALVVVTTPYDLPAPAGGGGGTPPPPAAAGRGGGAALFPGAQHDPPHGFLGGCQHTALLDEGVFPGSPRCVSGTYRVAL